MEEGQLFVSIQGEWFAPPFRSYTLVSMPDRRVTFICADWTDPIIEGQMILVLERTVQQNTGMANDWGVKSVVRKRMADAANKTTDRPHGKLWIS
jgi:hypothetical protein